VFHTKLRWKMGVRRYFVKVAECRIPSCFLVAFLSLLSGFSSSSRLRTAAGSDCQDVFGMNFI